MNTLTELINTLNTLNAIPTLRKTDLTRTDTSLKVQVEVPLDCEIKVYYRSDYYLTCSIMLGIDVLTTLADCDPDLAERVALTPETLYTSLSPAVRAYGAEINTALVTLISLMQNEVAKFANNKAAFAAHFDPKDEQSL